MFVTKLFRNMKLSGKWKTLFIKKHKVTKLTKKAEKKYGKGAGMLLGYSLAFKYLNDRYSKYLDSIVDPNLDVELNSKPEKIIWWMWLQGEENAPDICKSCLKSIKDKLPDYKVNVLTDDNLFDFVHVSDNIKKKYQSGLITRTHFSDICRAALLSEYGGIWVDSTVLFTGDAKEYLELPLFCFKNFEWSKDHPMAASSWLITSCKHHPIIDTTFKLLTKYWDDTSLLIDYYTYHYFFKMATLRYSKLWKAVPNFPNKIPHILQYELFDDFDKNRYQQICKLSPIHKLNWHYQNTDKASENKKDFYHAICELKIFE